MAQICRHPECDEIGTDTYEDRIGNELKLCSQHYFEAVYPGSVARVFKSGRDDRDNTLLGFLR